MSEISQLNNQTASKNEELVLLNLHMHHLLPLNTGQTHEKHFVHDLIDHPRI